MVTTTREPTVELRQGIYRGLVYGDDERRPGLPKPVEAFLGIPYGRVTRRFGEAETIPDGGETHDATRYGVLCPSVESPAMIREGWEVGEDCLSVNVFRPAGARDARDGGPLLPVVVFFHGGAFSVGKSADREMASFVGWAAEGVVGVSFNYRLGVLGFYSCGAGERMGCLNIGLRDQRAALVWVRENIARFGGDGGRVTAMGVSAGAHSIGHHILSADVEKPLFHRAIIESGAATARTILYPAHERQENHYRKLLAAAGVSTDLSPEDAIEALAALPVTRLVKATGAVWLPEQSTLRWPFQPTIDGPGGIIPDLPVTTPSTSSSCIPLITGFNSHEGAVFVPAADAETPSDFRAFFEALIPGLTPDDVAELERLYPEDGEYLPLPDGLGPQFPRLAAAYADHAYVAPVLHTAHRNARRGEPTYVYEFAARCEPFGAANHGSEGDVVARDVGAMKGQEGLQRVAQRMHGLFSGFATADALEKLVLHGDEGVEWPPFETPFGEAPGDGAGRILVFGKGNDERAGGTARGTPTGVRSLTEREIERCRFWWDRMVLSQGSGERPAGKTEARI